MTTVNVRSRTTPLCQDSAVAGYYAPVGWPNLQ